MNINPKIAKIEIFSKTLILFFIVDYFII